MGSRGRSVRLGALLGAFGAFACLIPGTALAASGELDRSFGGDGMVTSDFYGGPDEAGAVAVDSLGRIVVGGTADAEGYAGYGRDVLALARYLPDGSPDPSFGGDGLVISAPEIYAHVSSVAIDEQDRIVIGGHMSEDFESLGILARYLPNGDIDTSFGEPGFDGYDFAAGGLVYLGRSTIPAIRIGPDGYIYAGRSVHGPFDARAARSRANAAREPYTQIGITRITTDGDVDPSFGDDGTAFPWETGRRSYLTSFVFDRRGKINIVGSTGKPYTGYPHLAAARLKRDGSLDRGFGDGGRVVMFKGKSVARGFSVATDRRGHTILAGCSGRGYAQGAIEHSFLVIRLEHDGSRDRDFADNGVKRVSFGRGYRCARSAVLPNGRILVGGYAGTVPRSRESQDFALAMLTDKGKLDRSFGGDGKVKTDFGGASDGINEVVVAPDGGFIAAGFGHLPGQQTDFAVARYEP